MSELLRAIALERTHTERNGGAVHVLRDVSVTVRAGELVTVVGPSGSGKSTLLQCLSGLDRPTSGSVSVLGTDLSTLGADAFARFRRDHIGFVFQAYNLIPSLTAYDNVALPLRLRSGRVPRRQVLAALDAVGLADVADHRPAQLSGGQQQRVAIARTVATEPALLFADEPTGALDSESGAQVLRLLRAAASGTRSVVMVTHDLEAAALGDRVLVLRDGGIHQELYAPTPSAVFEAVANARSDAR